MNWLESLLNEHQVTRYRLSKDTGINERYLGKIIEKDIHIGDIKHWQALAIINYFQNKNRFTFHNSLILNTNSILQKELNILSSSKFYTVNYSTIAERGLNSRKENKNNNYSELNPAENKNGIYFLYHTSESGHVDYYYIGINKLDNDRKQDLYTRMTQHFTASNTGGLPFKLAKQFFLSQSYTPTKDEIDDMALKMLKYLIDEDLQLTFYVLDESVDKIKSLEKFLIKLLQPKYNTQLK